MDIAEPTTLGTQMLSPQARPGNLNAVKHQLYSQTKNVLRLRSRRVTSRVRKAWKTYPWLDRDKDAPDVRLWAILIVLTEERGDVLITLGEMSRQENKDLIPQHLSKDFSRLTALRLQLEDRLGITYSSRRTFGLGGVVKERGLTEVITEQSNGKVIEADDYHVD